jgi:hypothetical protein
MKKLVAVVLVSVLLVPLMASPALAWRGGGGWHGHGGCCWGSGFGVGVGVGVLATAPFWYPRYGYPAYAYPAYPYPAYGYPAYSYPAYGYPAYPVYPAPVPPPPAAPPGDPGASYQPNQSTNMTLGTPVSNPPAGAASAPAAGQNCATVTVEGHNETRTLSNGQTVTAWIPTSTQQVCQ